VHHLSIDIICIVVTPCSCVNPLPTLRALYFSTAPSGLRLTSDFGAFWDIRFFDLGESGAFTSCDRSFSLTFAHSFGWCEDQACSLVGWSAYSEDSGSRLDF